MPSGQRKSCRGKHQLTIYSWSVMAAILIMSIKLQYYAPDWMTDILQGITAMPPMPLSRIERLVLGRPPSINRSEKEGEERVWDSMGITAPQPWAARWLSACHEPDCGAYAWMQV